MSFRTSARVVSSPFELLRRSFLQADGLTFGDALNAEQIAEAFAAEGVSFGQPGSGGQPPVYTMAITLWAMVSQALFTDLQRSCRAAVLRVAVYYALLGRQVSTNTGAYCRARAKIGEGVVRRLTEGVAQRCEADVPDDWKWLGMTVRLADGSDLSMPDTPENQAEYPQPRSQAPGVGFPLLRLVALVSLATGMVTATAHGPYAGKETGETALLRTLFDSLHPGEVVLGDRYFGGWFMLALLQQLGVHFVVRMHQLRQFDFRRGRRLGSKDHVVAWKKPQRPQWMDQETYDGLPEELAVRETHVAVPIPGFRTESLVVVSSFLNEEVVGAADLADLYRQRWQVELHLRDIKSTMDLDVLRGQTPDMVRQELWSGLLAYNLIRQSLLQSALAAGKCPSQLSFAATSQMLTTSWMIAALPPGTALSSEFVMALRIISGGAHHVGNRPNRIEPRAIKRRPLTHDLLREPRAAAIAKILQGRAA